MPEIDAIHELVIRKLSGRGDLEAKDRAAIRDLPFEMRDYAPSGHMVREAQVPHCCAFLVTGFTYRQKLTSDGDRALVSIQVPGDFVDLQNIFLAESDHDVRALTHVRSAEVPIEALRNLFVARPAIARAMWIDGLMEASVSRQWLLNIGRRNGRARLAHLLCEFSVRLQTAGLVREGSFDLPMTQEQLGDALGLTAVHVNRVLKSLEREGLIRRRKRQVTITDPVVLREVADFNDRYLHFGQSV